MKVKSGRLEITLAASSLRCSSFLGFLLRRKEQSALIQYLISLGLLKEPLIEAVFWQFVSH